MPVLRFQEVSKRYALADESVAALSNVSIDVAAGEFVGLIGRSGCGKTTFLNLAGAMDFPTAGAVEINGRSTAGLNDADLTAIRRSEVGFVFQFFQLLPTLNAVENVELPLQLAGRANPRPRALELLDLVDLSGLTDRLPYQLSGGQLQRVAIARALVHSPSLLLADEPIGALDSISALTVIRLLRRVADELNTAVVMATHSHDSAAAADRIVGLRDGRLDAAAGHALVEN